MLIQYQPYFMLLFFLRFQVLSNTIFVKLKINVNFVSEMLFY